MFYSLLPQRHRWVEAQGQAAEFIIDETFGVPGVGTVVAGEGGRDCTAAG
jgi:GTPase